MGNDNETVRREAWSAYWATGRLHSCADGSGRNYEGAIGAFWRTHFAGVAVGGRVLDLATGNGALPLLLQQVRGDAVGMDAVDLAVVAPTWHDPAVHARIRFHAGVRMEALPFEPATFDHVVSQFGFEYAERASALSECVRVAKPAASFAFVMHHADSVLVNVAREELRHHHWLASEEGLLRRALGLVPWMARIRAGERPTQAAREAREQYNRAMEVLGGRAASSPAPDLLLEARERTHGLVAATGTDALPVVAKLQDYLEELKGARLRMAEMVEHALDVAELEAMTGLSWR